MTKIIAIGRIINGNTVMYAIAKNSYENDEALCVEDDPDEKAEARMQAPKHDVRD